MSSDRARVSYDPSRQYRSVVAQQGRVTLEADVNEAQEIAGEILRTETIDIVGPSGTPDDGYAIKGDANRDFDIGPGTMYVGGERVTLAKAIRYSKQAEWLDHIGDPLWAGPPKPDAASEFVYLFLREQEVSAVEDTALREVALGGPDTAQRKRLLQRIVRLPVKGDTCVTALQEAEKTWSAAGATFEPATMMLKSPARLKVALLNQPTKGTVCEPQAQGGYIGADNQLIRVQISHCDGKGGGSLVWSRDDASFLYRLKPGDKNNKKLLTLLTTPIDDYHAPRANHPVEVLRSAVLLSDDPSIDPLNRDYVAAHCGEIAIPASGLADNTLMLPNDLPDAYIGGSAPLFLRLWEEQLPFTSGTPVTLTGTGLQVTIDLHGSAGSFTVGQFWTFAVRPNTPAEVYPHRYLFQPQPPEGPRLWACPLATIGWQDETFKLLDDCRNPFDNLVELTKRHDGCCGVVVTPGEIGGGAGLQVLIDKLAGQKATVSLMPGLYELPQPLMLNAKHSGLTLEGCHDGAVLAVKLGSEDAFPLGLVQTGFTDNLTVRRLTFQMPQVKGTDPSDGSPMMLSFGMLALQCADLRIEECLFSFRLKTDVTLYAVGVNMAGTCPNLIIERNRFLPVDKVEPGPLPKRVAVGVVASLTFPSTDARNSTRKAGAGVVNQADGYVAQLDNAWITRNEFAGLTMALYVRGEIGRLFCDDNTVQSCDGGFYFGVTDLGFAGQSMLNSYRPKYQSDAEQQVFQAMLQATQAPMHTAMYDIAIRNPLPAPSAPLDTIKVGKPLTVTMENTLTEMANTDYAQLLAAYSGDAKTVKEVSGVKIENASQVSGQADVKASAGIEQTEQMTIEKVAIEQAPYSAQEMEMGLAPFYSPLPEATVVRIIPRLRFTGNDVEILPVTDNSRKGLMAAPSLALYVALPPGEDASVALTANNLRGSTFGAYIAIIRKPTVATATGNMILNNAGGRQRDSLWLETEDKNPLMNVSGNAFRGTPYLAPGKPVDAGCDAASWSVLNSTQY